MHPAKCAATARHDALPHLNLPRQHTIRRPYTLAIGADMPIFRIVALSTTGCGERRVGRVFLIEHAGRDAVLDAKRKFCTLFRAPRPKFLNAWPPHRLFQFD